MLKTTKLSWKQDSEAEKWIARAVGRVIVDNRNPFLRFDTVVCLLCVSSSYRRLSHVTWIRLTIIGDNESQVQAQVQWE